MCFVVVSSQHHQNTFKNSPQSSLKRRRTDAQNREKRKDTCFQGRGRDMSSSLCSCGQGTCVESPLPQFQTLCLCHNGFSGRADYFDLRVFINSTTELSLSCPVSEIATNVVWTLFLLAYTVRFGVTMYVLVVLGHMKKLRSISKKLMLFDLFGCIFALSIPIQKLWFVYRSQCICRDNGDFFEVVIIVML